MAEHQGTGFDAADQPHHERVASGAEDEDPAAKRQPQ